MSSPRDFVEEVVDCFPVVLIFTFDDRADREIAELHRVGELLVVAGIGD